jgi:hypothetical protein
MTRTWLLLAPFLLAEVAHAGASAPGYYPSSSYWRQQSATDFVARPDTLTVGFNLRKNGSDVAAVVASMQKSVGDVGQRLQSATAGAAIVRMRNIAIEPVFEKQGIESRVVSVDGIIDVPLAADADFWARARLVAAISQATRAFTDENKKSGLQARFDRPTAVVKDPESFRPELMKQWLERARGFAQAAQSPAAPLQLLSCDPPGMVQQIHLDLDEVALRLPQSCRIDALRK